jgi:hypothetical protein
VPPQGAPPAPPRILTQVPHRESFRDAKFRIQNRVISDLDPKLDLATQIEVRKEIEEAFGRALDEEGLALTRAERFARLMISCSQMSPCWKYERSVGSVLSAIRFLAMRLKADHVCDP